MTAVRNFAFGWWWWWKSPTSAKYSSTAFSVMSVYAELYNAIRMFRRMTITTKVNR